MIQHHHDRAERSGASSSSAAWRPLALAIAVAGTSCDALIGLGDAPSPSPTGTSTTTGGHGGGSSTGEGATATGAGGEGVGVSTAATAQGGGGGEDGGGGTGVGAGGGGFEGSPCGACDEGCMPGRCDDQGRCLLRRHVVPDTERVGEAAGDVVNRFGRGFVVSDAGLAFVRRSTNENGGRIRLVAPDATSSMDVPGPLLASDVAGIALSGDGQVIVVTPHAQITSGGEPTATVFAIHLDGSPEVEPVSTITSPLLAAVESVGPGKAFFAAERQDGHLWWLDLGGSGSGCQVGTAQIRADAVDVDVAAAAAEGVSVLQYVAPGRTQVYEGELACPIASPVASTSVSLQQSVLPHALDRSVHGVYVLGVVGDAGYVARGPTDAVSAHPGVALDAYDGGVMMGAAGGGLQRCAPDLTGCQVVLGAGVVGEVGLVRRTLWGVYTVGMPNDGAGEQAIVVCAVEPGL